MVAHGRLGQSEDVGEVAADDLALGGAEQLGHDLDPHRIGQGFEPQRHLQRLFVGHGAGRDGCAADGCGDIHHGKCLGHGSSIPNGLTYVKEVAHWALSD